MPRAWKSSPASTRLASSWSDPSGASRPFAAGGAVGSAGSPCFAAGLDAARATGLCGTFARAGLARFDAGLGRPGSSFFGSGASRPRSRSSGSGSDSTDGPASASSSCARCSRARVSSSSSRARWSRERPRSSSSCSCSARDRRVPPTLARVPPAYARDPRVLSRVAPAP